MRVNLTRSFLAGFIIPPILLSAHIFLQDASRRMDARTTAALPGPGGSAFALPSDVPAAEDGERIDLGGNGVRPAVSRYRIDARGGLYDVYAPHVAIPKLAPPKS
jgi:hypothetical protein